MPPTNGTSTIEIENFAFLYETFPTANVVFVYTAQYIVFPDMIAGEIICIIGCVSASINRVDMFSQLQEFDVEVALVSLFCNFLAVLLLLSSE